MSNDIRKALEASLFEAGFKREEDWFVRYEGEPYMEQVHIDTVAALGRAALSQPPQAAQSSSGMSAQGCTNENCCPHPDKCEADAGAQAAQPTTGLDRSALIREFCAKWSGYDKPEAGDVLDWLMSFPAQAAQPEAVAWCALTQSGKIAYFDGKPMVMPGPVGNEHHPIPLYATPPAPAQPAPQAEPAAYEAMNRAADLIAATLGTELTKASRQRLNEAHNLLVGTHAAPASLPVGELPPLPQFKPVAYTDIGGHLSKHSREIQDLGYSPIPLISRAAALEAMRDYARAALASAPQARRPLDEALRLKAFQYLCKQKLDDGTPFCDAYTAVNLTFTPADIEYVREENGELRIGFWRGNSNLYWPVRPEDWESLPADGGKS